MRKIGRYMVSLLTVALLGCSEIPPQPGPGFGNSVLHNAEVQIVDPQPSLPANDVPEMNGKRAALAINRYHQGKTVKAVTIGTETSTSGGTAAP